MEIILGSKHFVVDYNCVHDVSGREYLVVIAKSTWQIPASGQRPRPLPPQAISMADVFIGDPENSAMIYGSDIVRFKPRCDVLFNATAYAQDNQPVRELTAVWQVGSLRKGVRVHGARQWRMRLGIATLTEAAYFVDMPLHFGVAFGGTRTYKKGWGENAQMLFEAKLENPIGLGWFGSRADESADGYAAPHLEALDDPVRKPNGKQKPIAFSAIARHWQPRPKYAGTYDQQWQRDVFPFLPEDFDEQFNQCAPTDQQMAYPSGGEQVILRNMMIGRPDVRFKLPRIDNVTVRILRRDYSSEQLLAVPDTLYFEPDHLRFSVVWRVSTLVQRSVDEFKTLAVGPISGQLWREKAFGADGCDGCGNSGDQTDVENID